MFDDEKDKWGFTNINMDTIVGTDVPGGPRKMKDLHTIMSIDVQYSTDLQYEFDIHSTDSRGSEAA